jgi:hypothetical protein
MIYLDIGGPYLGFIINWTRPSSHAPAEKGLKKSQMIGKDGGVIGVFLK